MMRPSCVPVRLHAWVPRVGALLLGLAAAGQAHAGPWTATAPLNESRYMQAQARLADGRVLVAGGYYNPTHRRTAEIFDPATGAWTPTGSMSVVRVNSAATTLPDGRVLVAGGYDASEGFQASAEVYDPVTGVWTATLPMSVAHSTPAVFLLASGKVLVLGGASTVTELYDPATNTWTPTGTRHFPHSGFRAALLSDGRVLAFGGGTPREAEIYDPTTMTWTATGSMIASRPYHPTATLLSDGRVLAAGGTTSSGTTAEAFNPATGTWSSVAPTTVARTFSSGTRLDDGRVLVASGTSSEIYDPVLNTWTLAGALTKTRSSHRASLLLDGRVLLVGGSSSPTTAEVFDLSPTLAISDVSVTESGSAVAAFTVSRFPASDAPVSVDWSTAVIGGAASGVDYVASSGTLSFAAGETSQVAAVQLIDDAADEGTESFYVDLSNASGAVVEDGQGRAQILDDDPLPVLAFSGEPTITESDDTARMAAFTVTLAGATHRTVDVTFATGSAGTASGSTGPDFSDYVSKSGTLRFTPGQSSKVLKVQTLGDSVDEPNETFFLTLSNPSNGSIGDTEARAIIVDNDPTPAGSPSLAISNAAPVAEGDTGTTNAVFTVTLSAPSASDVIFTYATGAGGTATSGVDYGAFGYRSATIAAGQTSRTIPVTVNGDDVDEANETFYVNVTSASNATIVDGQGKGTITDDEP